MGYVVYLDTGNSFSAQRIAHFVGQITDSAFIQVIYFTFYYRSIVGKFIILLKFFYLLFL